MQNSIGHITLESINSAKLFNQWMYKTIAPFLSGNILEVGSGIGNLSSFFIADKKMLSLSDYNYHYVDQLRKKFSIEEVKNIYHIDLADRNFHYKFAHLAESFDSIFLLNVLEHIYDDHTAIKHCRFLLKPGGTLLILVPSYSFLFSRMDQLLGHYRRYNIATLKKLVEANNLRVTEAFYFNCLGIAGWLWNKLLGNTEISKTKMNMFNRLVSLAKFLDNLIFHKAGLSTIIVTKKTEISKI